MSDKLDRFVNLMKGIFELDKSDLDFGIYRIMNIRKAEIEKFLSEGLPAKITETLAPFAQNDTEEIKKKIESIEQQASAFGMDISALPDDNQMKQQYNSLKSQLAGGTDLSALESDVYSALYNFFNRYYDEGDFISKRRYKEGVYAIPYEGEEVKLYWANQDQYYIKTSENFKDYTFKVDDYSVHFRIVDATTEQNNNKESDDSKRVFMLFTEDEENFPGIKTFEHNADTKEIIIRFVYDIPEDKKRKYAEENYKAVHDYIYKNNSTIPVWQSLLAPVPTGKGKETTTLLEKHMKAYVAKNTFDYFIHKDLKGFLTRELDFYIKSEIMHLDDLDTSNEQRVETYLAKVKAVKRVGTIIIDFLAQIENFQKKLWLKKKFVIETNWCITLDRIDEKFYPEIIENKAQIQEWIDMYAVDEIKKDLATVGFSNPPTAEFLRQNLNLVVDTKHFTSDFKERLIASIDNLDENTDGLLISSENLQAMNLLLCKYCGSIDAIITDPPYNTGDDGFIYKDNYLHSSWLSMINDRLQLAYSLLSENSWISMNINDIELSNILQLFNNSNWNTPTNITVKMSHLSGMKMSHIDKKIPKIKESILLSSKGNNCFLTPIYEKCDWESSFERYKSFLIKNGSENPGEWSKTTVRSEAIRQGIDVKDKQSYDEFRIKNADLIFRTAVDDAISDTPKDGIIREIITSQGIKKYILNGEDVLFASQYMKNIDGKPSPVQVKGDIWDDIGINNVHNEGGVQLPNGKKPVKLFERLISLLSSKRSGIILDFFAGSATTAHAVINHNKKNENATKKYILIQDDDLIFSSKTLKRTKNVIYSNDWKLDKAMSHSTGVSHIMKYMKLESYEDALSNISLDDEKHGLSSLFGDDYLINYMLDIEAEGSLLNLDAFRTPFEYKLKVTENNETKEKNVDVVETFNYLIGLTVQTASAITYFNAVKDENGEYEGAVRLIKDIGGTYGFKQIEGTTPDGKRVLVIWRTISDNLIESNAALDAYFSKHRINPQDREYDIIYVNGDNNLQNISTDEDSFKVQMTELEFKKRMFEEE